MQTQAWGYAYNFGYGKCNMFIGYSARKRNCGFKVEDRKVYNNQMNLGSIKVQVGKIMSRQNSQSRKKIDKIEKKRTILLKSSI